MEQPVFNKDLHIKYWRRCLKSVLPTEYTSTDSSRLSLGFFILSAFDLLGVGGDQLDRKDVAGLKKWILNCEHPNGGFCGSPNHKYPSEYYRSATDTPSDMDPANLPATFFALMALNFVGKVSEVDRKKCLRWLKKLQREDGSFGETLGKDGKIEGGRDMRYCQCAAAIRWILRGDLKSQSQKEVDDIDVDGLVGHIRKAETYDGGLGESFEHESHAGYTYCGIASLSNLGRLPESLSKSEAGTEPSNSKLTGVTNLQDTIRWLMSRQINYVESDDDEGEDEEPQTKPEESSNTASSEIDKLAAAGLSLEDTYAIGCNGRLNKVPDTCYSFWVDASLYILGQSELINKEGSRRWLIEKTQHMIGGFAKEPGYPPDIYHSYLGLGTLAMLGEPNLKTFDPVLCASQEAKSKIEHDIAEFLEPDAPGKSVWDNIALMGNAIPVGLDGKFPKFWTDAEEKHKKMEEEGTTPLQRFEPQNIWSGET
ncbi:hypothetical protein V492_07755 [Pseudogymnoascus sp. VKM F-4246]|nr:hypothetical protein V492_07755 [Pseudogymnoascus sp. VKM F-4246]